MKILHITNVYAPAGGIENYVINLLSLLEQRGHQNALIYRQDHPRTLPANGKPIYHVPPTASPTQDRKRIRDLIQKDKPDVIYLHDVYDAILIKQVAQLAPSVGYVHIFYPVCPGLGKLFRRGDQICTRPFGWGCVPMIYLRRCANARDPRNVYRIMRRTEGYLEGYQSLSKIIVASQYMQRLMIQNQFDTDQVDILPPHFISTSDEIDINYPDENRDILFAGRLDYEKGVPYLLKAMLLIPEPHRLIIAGDGSLKRDYIQLAQKLGVAHRVQFAGWFSAKALNEAYQHCAVTVMPTVMPEPFGKVGVEAMANGCPVVAFNVGGISDWLKDGHNGFLVPPRDVDHLAASINRILGNPDLAARLGANGREYVKRNYSVDQHLDGLLNILQNVIN